MNEPEKNTKIKKFNFPREDRDHLMPIVSNKIALEQYVNNYVSTQILPRLGVKEGSKCLYNVLADTIEVVEEPDPEIILPTGD